MIHAQVITRWERTVDVNGVPHNDPAIDRDIPFIPDIGEGWADATGQPSANLTPAPNLLVVECVVSDATFAAILAHPDYGPGAVLWSETL